MGRGSTTLCSPLFSFRGPLVLIYGFSKADEQA